jgi:hypothetical protein
MSSRRVLSSQLLNSVAMVFKPWKKDPILAATKSRTSLSVYPACLMDIFGTLCAIAIELLESKKNDMTL